MQLLQSVLHFSGVTISCAHFMVLLGREIQETYFSGHKCLSQAISALQKPRFLSSLSLQLGWSSSWLWQAPRILSCGHKQQPQLPVLFCMNKLFWINFAPLHVIRKQECLWLCLVKTSAGEAVVSRQISTRSCTDYPVFIQVIPTSTVSKIKLQISQAQTSSRGLWLVWKCHKPSPG